jgi:N-acyl amino acid synthase of PEP-CTERM/exosortase system
VEVSRFAISKHFRRRLDEFQSPSAAGTFDPERERCYQEQELKIMPHISLGLFVAMVSMSREMGVSTWFCVMERALVRRLARYSLHFQPIGPIVEHHGKRQPCYADIDGFLKRAKLEQPDIWELITDNGALWRSDERLSQVS